MRKSRLGQRVPQRRMVKDHLRSTTTSPRDHRNTYLVPLSNDLLKVMLIKEPVLWILDIKFNLQWFWSPSYQTRSNISNQLRLVNDLYTNLYWRGHALQGTCSKLLRWRHLEILAVKGWFPTSFPLGTPKHKNAKPNPGPPALRVRRMTSWDGSISYSRT